MPPVVAFPGKAERALATHRFLLRLALSAGTIFGWAFIFRGLYLATGNLAATLVGLGLLYILSQCIVVLLTPLTGAALRHGIKRALVYGTVMAAFAFICMSLIFSPQINAGGSAFGLIVSFVLFTGLHRALYWIPYATSSVHMPAQRFPLTKEAMIALMPLIAGVIIENVFGGAGMLMGLAGALVVFSLLPLIGVQESFERFEWGYGRTYRELFSPFNRGALKIAIADGIQGVTLLLIWPLAAFVILGQSFASLGVILTLTFFIGFLTRSWVRRLLRSIRADQSTAILATIAFSSWILRLPAGTPVQILMADVYYHVGVPGKRFSIDATSFDQSADGGHFVDEYTALKEMGMALGRILACALLVLSALFMGATIAFGIAIIVAGISAAYSVVVSRRMTKEI